MPIVTQVANYLSAHTSFNSNQLVLVNGGANDIFQFAENTANLTALATALQTQYPLLVQAGTLPNSQAGQVAFIVGYLSQLPNPQVAQAATQLAAQVKTIVNSGATHVVVSTVPDIGNTPLGVAANASTPGSAALLTGIAAAYNAMFVQNLTALGLLGTGKVIVVDAFTSQDQQLPNYKALGFTVSNTGTACNLAAMQSNATAYARANPSATNGLTRRSSAAPSSDRRSSARRRLTRWPARTRPTCSRTPFTRARTCTRSLRSSCNSRSRRRVSANKLKSAARRVVRVGRMVVLSGRIEKRLACP
ncbi:MAG: Phospholipase/lecithinase/hemolysin [uncultured Paraburkholderia sp.]|nr:MAG: Phospholipase/lecithinase/hemolysin [uncultured Paraburkholderia sp.]